MWITRRPRSSPPHQPPCVGFTEPRRHCKGIMLVGRTIIGREYVLPKRRVNLDNNRLSCGNRPAIEGPEVQAAAKLTAQVQQLGNAGMGRFGHRPLDVEMKHRLGPSRHVVRPSGASGCCRYALRRCQPGRRLRNPHRYSPTNLVVTASFHLARPSPGLSAISYPVCCDGARK